MASPCRFDNNAGGKGYIDIAEESDRIYPVMVDNGRLRSDDSTKGAVSKVCEQAIEACADAWQCSYVRRFGDGICCADL